MKYLRVALLALLLYTVSGAGRDATEWGSPAIQIPESAQLSPDASGPSPEGPAYGVIRVHLFGMRNDRGEILVNLYRRARGFPFTHALAQVIVTPNDGQADVDLGPLPYGLYAISACHDENRNGRCDTRLIGVPKEETGTSNNPRRTWLAPYDFDASSVQLEEPVLPLSIDMTTPNI